MTTVIIKTNTTELHYTKQEDGQWLLRETRQVRCFRPGSYRRVEIKPVLMSGKAMKAQLKALKQNETAIHWIKTA